MKKKNLSLCQEEDKLLTEVSDWLKFMRPLGIKMLRINDRYHKGYSDIFVCVQGLFVILELKADEGIEAPHQKVFIEEMHEAKAIGGFCRSLNDVKKYIQEALTNADKYQR